MADKMMRMAGRDPNGNAKNISVDGDGKQIVFDGQAHLLLENIQQETTQLQTKVQEVTDRLNQTLNTQMTGSLAEILAKGARDTKERRYGGTVIAPATETTLLDTSTATYINHMSFSLTSDEYLFIVIEIKNGVGGFEELRIPNSDYKSSSRRIRAKDLRYLSAVPFLELALDEPGYDKYSIQTPKGSKEIHCPYGYTVKLVNTSDTKSFDYMAIIRYYEVNL